MHNILFIYLPTQTVEVSLNYLYYQCHISGEKLHGKRCVNTFLYIKSGKKQFYQRYEKKMFSFYAIWFGLYRIYTFGVSYLFLMVVLHSGTWMWFSPPLFWDRACRGLCRMGFWELARPSVNRFFIPSYLLTISCEEKSHLACAGAGWEGPSPNTIAALSVIEKLLHKEHHFSSLNPSFPSVLLLED